MEGDTLGILLQLQAALKTMFEEEFRAKDCSETMLNLVSSAPTCFGEKLGCRSNNFCEQIEECAADIWNYAVAKKASISAQVNATLRYVACTIVYKCRSTKDDECSLRKQIMMSLKTARACLDCGNNELARNAIDVAVECNDNLRLLWTMDQGFGERSSEFPEKMMEVERNQLKTFLYKAELLFDPNNGSQSFNLLERARPMLTALPDEAVTVAVLCQKFGVNCYQKQLYDESVTWLKLSYELGKLSNTANCKTQACTLRVLAKVYLDWDSQNYWQKAFNTIGLANAEHSHPLGLHLKLQILLTNGNPENDAIRQTLDELLNHPDLPLDMAISSLSMICKYNKNEIAIVAANKLAEKFQGQSDVWKVKIAEIEIHLQSRASVSDARLQTLIQTIVQDQKSGVVPEEMTAKVRLMLWNQAAATFELDQYSEALMWYDLCSQFFPSHVCRDSNLAKLYRNKGACYISLNQLDMAQEELAMAAQCEPDSSYLYFLQYKLNLLKRNDESAVEALKRLVDCDKSSDTVGLICLAANLAYKESRTSIAVEALESLAACSADDRQVLTTLRWLTRMKCTSIVTLPSISEPGAGTEARTEEQKQQQTVAVLKEMRSIVGYIQTAFEKLTKFFGQTPTEHVDLENEATWFTKIAWNMALKCDTSEETCELFVLCNKLANLCPKNIPNVTRQKRCLLMAAALCLQLAKSTKDEAVQKRYLQDTLLYAQQSQTLCSYAEDLTLHSFDGNISPAKDTTSLVLLLLYEFEARVRLNDGEAEKLFERAIFLPYMEAKSFELMAAVARQSRCCVSLSMKALRVAIKKYRAAEKINYTKCSCAVRSLIELSLQTSSSTDALSKRDAWSYFMDAMEFIDTIAKTNYPEMEIVWLMTKAWNCGIHLYSGGHYQDALRWCELGLSFIKRLTSFKSSYENQMMTAYGEILAKSDAHKSSHTQNDDVPMLLAKNDISTPF